ncbi:MAG TPA: histidinol dehydrogenase [Cyclobacteriaceae bacterium]|nr:histidinol dehydrogenase [Cyclobacteriaceae bacterium]
MQQFINPSAKTWPELCARPQVELEFLENSVKNILARVQRSGDDALRELTKQLDRAEVKQLQVSEKEIREAVDTVPQDLKDAIAAAANNIGKFHEAQRQTPLPVETMPGVKCWRKAVPIQRVGVYIPGGSAPLFSTVLMLGVPSRLAGCKEVVLCTPPDADGKVNSAILYAAQLTGITKIFKVGGAQAIAAMAYGTESIPKVFKIFGPGNQYVTKAKQLVNQQGIAIDKPAGPSEVLVWADETANPAFVAADLLSQAEHGEDSQVMLVVNNEQIISAITTEIDKQLTNLPRKSIAEKALQNSKIICMSSVETAVDFINEYAPEHLIINTQDADGLSDKIVNAGSVFIGNYSPEAVGDYASGTNHTLPTNGYAKASGGVSLESFIRYITFQKLTENGLKLLGPVVEKMAEAEQLTGHKQAVTVRLATLN